MQQGKHEKSVRQYIKDYDLLSNDHPVIVNLIQMSIELDTEFKTSTAQQFQLTMRWLEARKLQSQEEGELDDDLLTPNRT